MARGNLLGLLVALSLLSFSAAQGGRLRFCSSIRFAAECEQMDRGNSQVECIRVQDSIECAQRMLNNTADFGIFGPETVLQIGALAWDGISVVKELRHSDRSDNPVDYESVVIVRSEHQGGTRGLRGAKFCHPGLFYDRSQRWSERFLKHFERAVVPVECELDGVSPAEIEASAMSRFFTSACRPGAWSNNPEEDARLKEQFPNLCELCDPGANTCDYPRDGSGSENSHAEALRCLIRGGTAAYVALEVVQDLFNTELREHADSFAYLCPNDTLQSITFNDNPCVWLRQPWRLVVSSDAMAVQLPQLMNDWFNTGRSEPWKDAIKAIITAESSVIHRPQSLQRLRDYVRSIREIPIDFNFCSTRSTWCTTSADEYEKCLVISAGGLTSGVLPTIECRAPRSNPVACLNDINTNGSDFMGIDSNFGFLARHVYNLSAAMYAETESNKYSSVVILVRANATFRGLESLRDTRACFPEYGGIAKVTFLNAAKAENIFEQNNCNFSISLGEFFGESCMPGARDPLHDPAGYTPNNLCSLCRSFQPLRPLTDEDASVSRRRRRQTEGEEGEETPTDDPAADPPADDEEPADEEEDAPADDDMYYEEMDEEEKVKRRQELDRVSANCNPDATNRFYGNQGALRCLAEVGDIAVLELQYLKQHAHELMLNPHDFRVLCKNGSLAAYPGFNVDPDCVMTTIIDGEIVVRRDSARRDGIINALTSFDLYFQNQPDFKMYNIFAGVKHLLFKDSTIGLVRANATDLSPSVQNYIDIFDSVEICARGSGILMSLSSFLFTTAIFITIFRFR
ncbi:transferrin-like [Phlebotomus argentipes]|uniref:transferrin-like n=1 Tax=Phlebotomus argentipes TaxID=94469 RepID=UPI00289330D7|nr:transferrin-like [Phlebotomus argentipes]